MPEPKPFHIGTRVIASDIRAGDVPGKVHGLDPEGLVMVAFDKALNGFDWWPYEAGSVVHADDGAPLGEWVPLKIPEQRGHPQIDFNDPVNLSRHGLKLANAIIRGEVEQ